MGQREVMIVVLLLERLTRIGARMFTHELRWSADARRLPVQAAVVAMGAVALAGCNAKNAYVPPPPPKVVVAQPLQKPVTLYFELTGNTQAINSVDLVARVQGYLEFDRLQGRRVRNQGNAAVRHRARPLPAATRPGECVARRQSRRRSSTTQAEYERQVDARPARFRQPVDFAAMEGQSGFGGGAGAERQGGDRTRQDQSRLHERARAL